MFRRSFTKMKIAAKDGPSKGWYDNIENQRKADELLSYVRHARNADEHGIDRIVKKKSACVGISPKTGNSLFVDYMEIGQGSLTLGPQAAANAKIEFTPASVQLASVYDRGIVYQPPATHLGENLKKSTDPIEIGTHALAFLRGTIDDAGAMFL